MKPRAEENNIAIPPSLLAEIQAAAAEEKRPAEEVLREAIERYLETRRWQQLVSYGQQRAHELGLFFDLDGVTTSGTARFLSGFGGNIKTRLVITTGRPIYNVVESFKTIVRRGRSAPSSFS